MCENGYMSCYPLSKTCLISGSARSSSEKFKELQGE